jgi:hypothetical protein
VRGRQQFDIILRRARQTDIGITWLEEFEHAPDVFQRDAHLRGSSGSAGTGQ